MTKRLEMLLDEVRALPNERQSDIEHLLARELGHHVPLLDWQKSLLEDRLAEHERNPDDVIPAEQVFEELRLRWKR